MRRILLAAVILLVPALPAAARTVQVSDLDTDPARYAGQEVTIRGEIVGDYGIRSDVVWVQVNDDPYVDRPFREHAELAGGNVGIGVRIPAALFHESWGTPGGYLVRGPIVLVTGTFRYNDPSTGGETFVDASVIDLVEASRPIDQPDGPLPLTVGITTLVLGGITFALARWRWTRPPT
jgi:hypothetical protein